MLGKEEEGWEEEEEEDSVAASPLSACPYPKVPTAVSMLRRRSISNRAPAAEGGWTSSGTSKWRSNTRSTHSMHRWASTKEQILTQLLVQNHKY